jgi:hypothetical protein
MTPMSDPPEGFSTLAAQFTRKVVDRIVSTIRDLRRRGWTERRILAQLKKDLRAFPSHAIRRLYDLSRDRAIPDDVAASNIASEKEVKTDTLELVVRVELPGVEKGGLLQHRGSCWYVASASGTAYVLKKLA